MHPSLLAIRDVIWPPRCAACGQSAPSRILCYTCELSLIEGTDQCCPSCGLIWLDPPPGGGHHPCGYCLISAPPFIMARSAFAYGGALQQLIQRWKNTPDDRLSHATTQLLCLKSATWLGVPGDTIVVPVPAARRRLRKRGFNPAGLLARQLAAVLRLPLLSRAITLKRPISTSHHMSRAARFRRVRGAFTGHRKVIQRRPILLVDDVVGAGEVYVATLAGVAHG
jgi:predicted amidophosphoribosyltransferase